MNYPKNTLLFLLFLIPLFLSSQTNRAYYELTYKPNTTDTATKNILQVLIFNHKKSSFQSARVLKRDSIFQIYQDYKDKTGKELPFNNDYFYSETRNTYKITNTLHQNIEHKDIIGNMLLSKYIKKIELNWVLKSETKKINEINCQKATVKYGGRKWIAWFSNDYLYPFGPYKFHGLPGLIIQIYDEKENFIWKLAGIQKQSNDNFYDTTYFEMQRFSLTELNKKKFKKMQKYYNENPLGNINEVFPNISGEKLKKVLEHQKELRKKNAYFNNTVEL